MNIKHGLYGSPLYKLWYLVKNRCYNEQTPSYSNYGAKGVKMCDEWRNDFMAFYNWAVDKWQSGLQLDKDKLAPTKTGFLYCPEYCCFLTPKQNSQFRSSSVLLEYNGETKTMSEWIEILGLNPTLIRDRYKKRWETRRMFETPCLDKFRNNRNIK